MTRAQAWEGGGRLEPSQALSPHLETHSQRLPSLLLASPSPGAPAPNGGSHLASPA
ncbi:hypothetical protein P7K49_015240, partial [Saguinus oedipus]